jgi:hypothetical protein
MSRTPPSAAHPTAKAPFAAVATASRLARTDPGLATLERDKPGHGGAKLARRVKGELPDVPLAACRRAADLVFGVRLARPEHVGVNGRYAPGPRATPSRALGRTPKAVKPLAERLTDHKVGKVADAFEGTGFRHSRAWEGDLRVGFGAPDARQTTCEGWIDYKRDGHRRGIVGETVELTVPRDWGTRVNPLDVTSGLLPLDAEQLPTDGPVEVYRAVWCRQGIGVSLVVEHGFIARHTPSGLVYHSTHADPAAAVRGLKRQVTAKAVPSEVREGRRTARDETRRARKAEALAKLVRQVERQDLGEVAHVVVRLDDSYKAGNCVPGTLAFRDRLFPGRDSATIGVSAAKVGLANPGLLSDADLALVRQLAAACLVAIRRGRRVARAVGV